MGTSVVQPMAVWRSDKIASPPPPPPPPPLPPNFLEHTHAQHTQFHILLLQVRGNVNDYPEMPVEASWPQDTAHSTEKAITFRSMLIELTTGKTAFSRE